MRTDWSKRSNDPVAFQNFDETGQHTPGPDVEAVRFLVEERDVLGFGTETIGTDAGQAAHLRPPYPCHALMHGAGRFGLQCLTQSRSPPADRSRADRRTAQDQARLGLALARAGARGRMSAQEFPVLFPPGERNLPAMLGAQAARFKDKPLVTASGTTLGFREARELAAGFGGTLLNAGIKRGDRVALICGNSLDFVTIMLGAAWIGAVLVPINTGSRGPQLAHILRNCGARLLILEAEFLAALEHAEIGDTALETLWLIGEGEAGAAHGLPLRPLPAPASPAPPAAIGPGDTLAILYTSGTTGPSKGVICPHAQYFWWGMITAGMLGVEEGDVLVTPLPLFHSNALNSFYQALLMGAHVVYLKRFSVSGFFAALAEHKATVTYLLGAMVPMLLSRPPSRGREGACGAYRARARRAGEVPRGIRGAKRHRASRRLRVDGDEFRHRRASARAKAGHDGRGHRRFRGARRRRGRQ